MRKMRRSGTLSWIGRSIGKKKLYIIHLVLLQAFLGAASVCSALLFRTLIDQAVAGNREGYWKAVAGVAAIMAGQLAINALGSFLYEWVRAVMENQLKEKLFSCLLQKDYASVTAVHSGEWMNRLTSDTVVVVNGIVDIIPGLTGMVTRLLGALAALFALEPMFVSVLIPGGGVVLLLTYGFRKILKRLHRRIQEADGAVRVYLQERLESLMIVHTFAMEQETEKAAAEKMSGHKAARIRRNHLSNLCSAAFGAVSSGFYLFGAAYCGYGILKGQVSYGTMAAVLQLIGQIQAPFANITGFLPRYYAMIASAERLIEAENYEEDRVGEAVSIQEIMRFYREELKCFGLRKASFAYRTGKQEENSEKDRLDSLMVLDQVDLEVRKGEYVAFTGHSGCGKSTILKLLMSLYPLDDGERYITAVRESGDTMEEPLTARWRGLFAYVPQGNQLLSGTIREVVALGNRERMRQDAQLWQALKIACADEFVSAFEDGLDKVLGEHGSGLSEGQMQRIAIARAIFSGRPVLMLDEATSALDESTERQLLANLKSMTDKTVLIVTHRAEALRICDRKIVMTEKCNL